MFLRRLFRFLLSLAWSQNWLTTEDLLTLELKCDGNYVCCSQDSHGLAEDLKRNDSDVPYFYNLERELEELQRVHGEMVGQSRCMIDLMREFSLRKSKAEKIVDSTNSTGKKSERDDTMKS
eukprot:14306744-Ditylum_brightwellii.AAC.1